MGRPKGSKNKPKVVDSTSSASSTTQSQKIDKVDKLLLSRTTPTISTPKGKKTVSEMANTITKHERVLEMAKTTKSMIDALQLTDLSKTESRTFQTYSRETLRTYMRSPKSYESKLRNLSR